MGKSEPNDDLQRLFHETGWTLRQFTQAVNRVGTEQGKPLKYRESSAHQWLHGHMPLRQVRPMVLEALSRKLRRPLSHSEAGFPTPSVRTNASPSTVEELIDLGRQDMDPSRRGVIGASLFSVALAIPDWPDVVGRMEATQKGWTRRIGMPEVDMVIAMTKRISDVDDQFGGRHARPMAATFLVNTVSPYLKADAPEEVRRAMMLAASDLCYLVGYMGVDEGLNGLAQQYYVKALELAGAAEDQPTYCRALRGMSVQASYLGHGREAMELANAAADASPTAEPRMRAFLTGQQACTAAQVGDRRGALRYIGAAETAMERAESQGKIRYDASALSFQSSKVRYELGDTRGAVSDMERSHQQCDTRQRRTRLWKHTILAERQLAVGHLEAACASWNLALDEYPSVHSGRIDRNMRNMLRLTRCFQQNHAARELRERARLVVPPALVS